MTHSLKIQGFLLLQVHEVAYLPVRLSAVVEWRIVCVVKSRAEVKIRKEEKILNPKMRNSKKGKVQEETHGRLDRNGLKIDSCPTNL